MHTCSNILFVLLRIDSMYLEGILLYTGGVYIHLCLVCECVHFFYMFVLSDLSRYFLSISLRDSLHTCTTQLKLSELSVWETFFLSDQDILMSVEHHTPPPPPAPLLGLDAGVFFIDLLLQINKYSILSLYNLLSLYTIL